MKRSIYLAIAGIFLTMFSYGQNNLGVSTGFNYATIGHNNVDLGEFAGVDYITYGYIGILYKRNFDQNWSMITGLNYARKVGESKLTKDLELFGTSFEIGAMLEHRMDYLEVPLLFEYKFAKENSKVIPFIFAGPQISYETGYNVQVKAHVLIDVNLFNYDVNISNSMFNRFDVSGVVGAGLSIPLKRGNLNFDVRYVHGLMDILDNPIVDLNLKHRNIRVGATYFYDF